MLDLPTGLKPDLLYLFSFGPGYGESLLIRIPPDLGIIIDCLQHPHESIPAIDFARKERIRIRCIVLTHPHDDHAAGLPSVIDAFPDSVVGCVTPYVETPDAWRDHPDASQIQSKASVEGAIAAIRTSWEDRPASRWDLVAGTSRDVGEAKLTVLSPGADEVDALESRPPRAGELNQYSAALQVDWRQVRFLVGADLETAGWKRVIRRGIGLPLHVHHAYKIAHHGSRTAIHETLDASSTPAPGRFWMTTPWIGGKNLPRFEANEGLCLLLRMVSKIHLTSIADTVDAASPAGPIRATRQDILQCRLPGMRQERVSKGALKRSIVRPDQERDAWVLAGFDANGKLQDLRHGKHAVEVSET